MSEASPLDRPVHILVTISADGDFCRAGYMQCNFLGNSGPFIVCRAFKEVSTGGRHSRRAVRLHRDDLGRFERCQQCKDAQVPPSTPVDSR